MIALITFALLVVAVINIKETRKDTTQYNNERLARKDRAVAKSIEEIINKESSDSTQIFSVFENTLKNVGHIHNLKINIYDTSGLFVYSSDSALLKDSIITKPIPTYLINKCRASKERKTEYNKGKYRGTYRIIYGDYEKNTLSSSSPQITSNPVCILDVIYDKSTKDEINIKTNKQTKRLIQIYILLLLFASAVAYFLLQQITSPLRSISKHLSSANINNIPKPLHWPVKDEIGKLIEEYNKLMNELEIRTEQLIKSEKEGAWKKMAKQIAHEIKNPLTPMRLNVQYLLKSFNDGENVGLYSDEWKEKLTSFSTTMIQQIDTLTRISNAFSDFASLNTRTEESLLLVEEVKHIVHLFKNNNVRFHPPNTEHINSKVYIDKSHLTRVLNNLIKNSIQSETPNRPIEVLVSVKMEKQVYVITVKDNGSGIPDPIRERIFEPSFTTKNSGMGLGLAIVKKIINDFNGKINYTTSEHGTSFNFSIPIKN